MQFSFGFALSEVYWSADSLWWAKQWPEKEKQKYFFSQKNVWTKLAESQELLSSHLLFLRRCLEKKRMWNENNVKAKKSNNTAQSSKKTQKTKKNWGILLARHNYTYIYNYN